LAPEAVELVGRLPPLATVVSPSHISPSSAGWGPVPLRPAAAEVERILHVPLREPADPAVFRDEWGARRSWRIDLLFELEDETIGGDAHILVDLLGHPGAVE
jgi:hypothetical protein